VPTNRGRSLLHTIYRRTKGEDVKFLYVTLKTCTVSFRDLDGVEHSVSVTAETLFEAVAKGIAIFRTESWVADIGRGMTSLRITVKNPSVTHEVRLQEFEKWLERSSGSPGEMVLRSKLRSLLK
jgi:hypothetical protein